MTDWHNASLSATTAFNHRTSPKEANLPFQSRRSPFLCLNGCVSTSQPLASSIGLQILTKGGNAADAAIAITAALAVLEPCCTGLGGDMFALHYDSKARKVSAVNGSGRCPRNLNLDVLRAAFPGFGEDENDDSSRIDATQFLKSVHSVTIPGAARGWEDYYIKYGSKKFSFLDLLEPAAQMAEKGFPVAPITAQSWCDGLENDIKKWIEPNDRVPLSIDGRRGPKAGEIFRNPELARVLRSLGEYGATKGFYEAFPGLAIVDVIEKHGGLMTNEDMKESQTCSTFPEPICVEYNSVKLWQIPPNGQGIAGLIALSGLASLEKKKKISRPEVPGSLDGWKSSETWHVMIEAMRLGFADARAYVCDNDFNQGESAISDKKNKSSPDFLLDEDRIADRIEKKINLSKAVVQGIPDPTSCTVSFQVVDKEGNAVSFVNSNYMGFGTGIVPEGCGFTLQNRGNGFSLDPKHPNALQPLKRPYHTIIPGMLTYADTNELYATISNMGGFMQPQGHMQLTVGLVSAKLNPQEVVDMPRFCISDGTHNGMVCIEEGVPDSIIDELTNMGHKMKANLSGYERAFFGKAQIIKRDRDTGVLWAGSDGRGDGCAMGY